MSRDVAPRSLVLFAKEPKAGTVKTRLETHLRPAECARLAAALLADASSLLRRVEAERKVVAYAPREAAAAMRTLVGDGVELAPQPPGDLGERLQVAFAAELGTLPARVVVFGADSPTLPRAFFAEAFEALETRDLVLGPAFDFGYYLVGLRRPAPELFSGMPWGTSGVLPETLRRARRLSLSLHLLPPWYDVDTAASLAFLAVHIEGLRLAGSAAALPRATVEVLAQLEGRLPPPPPADAGS